MKPVDEEIELIHLVIDASERAFEVARKRF